MDLCSAFDGMSINYDEEMVKEEDLDNIGIFQHNVQVLGSRKGYIVYVFNIDYKNGTYQVCNKRYLSTLNNVILGFIPYEYIKTMYYSSGDTPLELFISHFSMSTLDDVYDIKFLPQEFEKASLSQNDLNRVIHDVVGLYLTN